MLGFLIGLAAVCSGFWGRYELPIGIGLLGMLIAPPSPPETMIGVVGLGCAFVYARRQGSGKA